MPDARFVPPSHSMAKLASIQIMTLVHLVQLTGDGRRIILGTHEALERTEFESALARVVTRDHGLANDVALGPLLDAAQPVEGLFELRVGGDVQRHGSIVRTELGAHSRHKIRCRSPNSCHRYFSASAASYALRTCVGPAKASSIARCVAFGSCSPVSRASTTRRPRSGVMTRSVQPREAITRPERSTLDSSARTTVVPTATTRPPRDFARRTSSAVRTGTSYDSSYGRSCASRLATPACSTSLARRTPRRRRHTSICRVNARPADGISADPGSSAYTVW